MKQAFLALALVAGLFLTPVLSAQKPKNIVLVYTDDQRWDTICWEHIGMPEICGLPAAEHPMPVLEGMLSSSVVFGNAFVTTPLCCPTRASLLSGGFYAHNTQVLQNDANGGAFKFIDTVSLGTLLQHVGYETALIGKYMNGYSALVDIKAGEGHVPPGWSRWAVPFSGFKRSWYVPFWTLEGSSDADSAGVGTTRQVVDTYLLDYERQQALDFLLQAGEPFFLMLSTNAPHVPADPPRGAEFLYSDFEYKGRGFGEAGGDLLDKPVSIQKQAKDWPDLELYRNMLRSLRGVDRSISEIMAQLKSVGRWDNTVFLFASDHGFLWWEHMQQGKFLPYEESIRVPFMIRYPGVSPRTDEHLVLAGLDLAATILDIAGVDSVESEGSSLLPLMENENLAWRNQLFHQYFLGHGHPTWASLNTDRGWKFIEYATGEQELYDLNTDPYELENLSKVRAHSRILRNLKRMLRKWPRGLAIRTDNLPDPGVYNLAMHKLPQGSTDAHYKHQFKAWGGEPPYEWSLQGDVPRIECDQTLPRGLKLSNNGLLEGLPSYSGIYHLCIQVEDVSVSLQPGNDRPQSFVVQFELKVQ